MTFEKIKSNMEHEEQSDTAGNTEELNTPEQSESHENAELLISTERDMLEEVLQEKIMASIAEESEKWEDEHKIVPPAEDENVESREQQQKNIESAGISSLINKMPKKAKRFINAMTMASIIAGSIGIAMMPDTAEAADNNNTYSWKEQVEDYREAYRKERARINKMISARHKAKKIAAEARTRQSLKRFNDKSIEKRHIKNHITRDARYSARGYDSNRPSGGKIVADFLMQMLNKNNQDNGQDK